MSAQEWGGDPILFWRPGCPYCVALKVRLRLARIPFTAVNIWQDASAGELVRRHHGGDELVPTVQVGTVVLSNPTIADIRRALTGRPI